MFNPFRALEKAFAPRSRTLASMPYNGASSAPRMRGWTATSDHLNTLIWTNGDTLRNRSRDAVRQNPWASSAVDKWVSNAIGTGIIPSAKHPDRAIKKQIADAWVRWVEEADADGVTDYYGLQALAFREMVEAGECFVRLRFRRATDGFHVPIQLQLIESEQVPYFSTVQPLDGNKVRCGIEFNAWGQRVAYHMYRSHPGDMTETDGRDIVRVPADQVIHLFRPVRNGQLRGEPWLAKILAKLHDFGRWEDAELMHQLVATLFGGYIKVTSQPDSPIMTGERDENNPAVEIAAVEPGSFPVLPPNMEPVFTNPPQAGDIEPYARVQHRGMAAGSGNTYSQVTGDYSVANYSSLRGEKLEFTRGCEMLQYGVFIPQFCARSRRAWMDAATLAGTLKLPGYERDPYPYQRTDWHTPKWMWVDPLKDVQAERMAVEAGFKTRTQVVSELGYDIEELDEERATDEERERRLGITPIYGTVRVNETASLDGSPQPAPVPQKGKTK